MDVFGTQHTTDRPSRDCEGNRRDYNQPTYSAVTGELRSKANIWQPPMSYSKLAKLSGLRHDHVSRIFRGFRRPTFDTLRRLSFPLQIDVYELARRLKC
jgi:transcriptional regulator with XRE-family HTH domain